MDAKHDVSTHVIYMIDNEIKTTYDMVHAHKDKLLMGFGVSLTKTPVSPLLYKQKQIAPESGCFVPIFCLVLLFGTMAKSQIFCNVLLFVWCTVTIMGVVIILSKMFIILLGTFKIMWFSYIDFSEDIMEGKERICELKYGACVSNAVHPTPESERREDVAAVVAVTAARKYYVETTQYYVAEIVYGLYYPRGGLKVVIINGMLMDILMDVLMVILMILILIVV